ncbi:MAG: hypothetical protein SVK08_00895 [Halobacteriota archaeon]|nr:hypothetical protein [Halobacteriota archaeon]
MPSGKREAQQFRRLGAIAAAQPEEIRQRRTAAEEAYTGVLGRLGAKGTYEQVGGAEPTPSGPTPEPTEGIFKTKDIDIEGFGTAGKGVEKARVLDPKAYQSEVEKSAQFRIMSRLTAESEQLLAREGPLYDEMVNSLQLPIIEGAGQMARENAEALKRAAARGGSARRSAMEAIQKIRSQERINSDKMRALSQSRFALDQWSRENARTNLEFGQNWASNLGGIRESYNKAMDSASALMVNSALPVMFQATQEAAKWRYYAHSKKRSKLTRWVSGIVGLATLKYGGGALLGQAISGPQAPV